MEISYDWQCDKSLQDCVKHMFDTETAADVTFLVGENKEIVRAHKFILICRSPVFYAMLEGLMSEKGEVAVPDIEKSVFVDFLRYLYTDNLFLSSNDVTKVMYAAKKYCVDRLAEECHTYMVKSLTVENACGILEHAHVWADESLASDCRKVICKEPGKYLKSRGFTNLCQSCVFSLTDHNFLDTTEDVVYKAVMRWSEAECNRQNLEVTDVNRRQVLGDVIYTVRFPLMDDAFFQKEVMKHDVLSPEETFSIARVKQGALSSDSIKYKSSARKYLPEHVLKITRLTVSGTNTWVHRGAPDAISFSASQNVMFHGIGVNGVSGSTNDKMKIILQLYTERNVLLKTTEQKKTTGLNNDIIDVKFDKPVRLLQHSMYTVVVTVSSDTGSFLNAKIGENGQQSVTLYGLDVSFFNSKRSKNDTCVDYGQIPCLYMYMC